MPDTTDVPVYGMRDWKRLGFVHIFHNYSQLTAKFLPKGKRLRQTLSLFRVTEHTLIGQSILFAVDAFQTAPDCLFIDRHNFGFVFEDLFGQHGDDRIDVHDATGGDDRSHHDHVRHF